ncbi:MAG TPA: chalcone isomerase family protein [Desulfobacterales bacterium]|nr:chalcone isomerase family protein [Desulfobacterales bacterium]
MLKRWVLLWMVVVLVSPAAVAMEIGGVVLPETLVAGTQDLALNGAGLRTKFFVKVYAGGLYLKQKSADAAAIVAADEPMAIRMHFIHDSVSSQKLTEAWNEGFANATGGATAPLQAEIDQFNGFFSAEAKAGDVYDIIYTPEQGVRVYAKGQLQGLIRGLPFKQAVFAIWLGEKPADKSLKAGMLGR